MVVQVDSSAVSALGESSGRTSAADHGPADRLWTAEDVSYYLGVPVGTLYYWRVNRTGPPAHRIGRHLRYRGEDVMAWVKAQDESVA
jgi:excisionase family DNA binding protein